MSKKRWQKAEKSSFSEEWFYVDDKDEVLVSVAQVVGGLWKVYERGAVKGEFLTKEAAFKRAESL